MIFCRSPLRISLGGGGTDLPSYYREHEGFLIAGAINKYVYINLLTPFAKKIILKYSQFESVENIDDVSHPIIRESLKLSGIPDPQIEITTMAEIPSGTGLGSSGSFTTALLKALYVQKNIELSKEELAKLACHLEIDVLGEPIGKQDQYIAAYGGLRCFKFHADNSVSVEDLNISPDILNELEKNLLLFFTGFSRSASSILKDQKDRSQSNDKEMIENLHFVKELGLESKIALESGNLKHFGALMHKHWEHKKRRSAGMSNENINDWYDHGIRNGAIGGKVVGAGGGGFLMFLAFDRERLRSEMKSQGLTEVPFSFDFEGTKLISGM
ncbi:galactokinase [Polynucleobacter sp. MG-6-Vaara-E2]|nr:galactokinase [Polynucleobacter sp. MG-6-Vaara-E2]